MRFPGATAFGVTVIAASASLPSRCIVQAFCCHGRLPPQRPVNPQKRSRSSNSHYCIGADSANGVSLQHGRQVRHRGLPRRRAAQSQTTTSLKMAFDPDVTPAALDAFHKWLGTKKDSNLKWGDQLALSGRSPLDGGRGLVATKTIESGKNVVAIPLSLALTASGLDKSGIARHVKEYEGWTGDIGMIALQLLWERAQGDKSPIAPWITVLPAMGDLDMPLFWGEEDLALADASSTRGISGFSADVDEDYAWLANNAFGANPDVFPEDKFGPADFRWAVGVALSRSFFVDGELRLTPLVDFANHASSRAMLEPSGGLTGLFGSKAVVLRAGRAYEEGEEFFVSYGPKGAAGYLEENGFVPPLSGSEVTCELEFSIAKDDRFFDDKEDILQSHGLGTSITFELTSVGLPDAELIRFLRLSIVGGEDAFLLESVFRNEVWDFMAEPISRTNEAAVNDAIASRCRTEIEGFYGTAEEDEGIVAGKREATPRQRLCATVRRGERLALQMTSNWCDTDSKALDRKEYYQERRLKDLQLDLPWEVDDVYPLDQQAGRMRRDLDW